MMANHIQFILLTGPPGVGKTTLIKKICNVLGEKRLEVSGFYTEEVRENRERIGFDVVLLDGRRAPLARTGAGNNLRGPKVGKYTVNVNSFETVSLPVFNGTNKSSILVLDEIGKMELLSNAFKNKVGDCFNGGSQVILGTVPSACNLPLVEKIKSCPKSLLIHVDRTNRDSLVEDIVKQVIDAKNSL